MKPNSNNKTNLKRSSWNLKKLPKMNDVEREALIAEYFAKGGKVTTCAPRPTETLEILPNSKQ